MNTVTFPPLMQGEAVPAGMDAFAKACIQARLGCDAGTVFYDLGANSMDAAIVFTPDVTLAEAVTMMPLCAIGLQNAIGALGPPEVAVHLGWDGAIRINGARCGHIHMAASDLGATDVPNWLVIGWHLSLWPDSEETGLTPDQTALYAEGCADIAANTLLESWARHTLSQINRWETEGSGPLHKDWRGLAHGMGEDVIQFGQTGTFLGVDEHFGMLMRDAQDTHLIPLTRLLREDV
ncbi:MAG: DUF4444 domain-containing protein [Aliishimia sp.]